MTLPKDPLPDLARDASRDVLGLVIDALIDDLHRHDAYRGQPLPRAEARPLRP